MKRKFDETILEHVVTTPESGIDKLVGNTSVPNAYRGMSPRQMTAFLMEVAHQSKSQFCYAKEYVLRGTALVDKKEYVLIEFPQNSQNTLNEIFTKISDKCIIVIPVAIYVMHSVHWSIIFYNSADNELEHFDSYAGPLRKGDYSADTIDVLVAPHLTDALRKIVNQLPHSPKFVPSESFCFTYQIMADDRHHFATKGGLCAAYSTLYAHLRMILPDWSRNMVIEEMFKLREVPFFFQRYIRYIDKTVGKWGDYDRGIMNGRVFKYIGNHLRMKDIRDPEIQRQNIDPSVIRMYQL